MYRYQISEPILQAFLSVLFSGTSPTYKIQFWISCLFCNHPTLCLLTLCSILTMDSPCEFIPVQTHISDTILEVKCHLHLLLPHQDLLPHLHHLLPWEFQLQQWMLEDLILCRASKGWQIKGCWNLCQGNIALSNNTNFIVLSLGEIWTFATYEY